MKALTLPEAPAELPNGVELQTTLHEKTASTLAEALQHFTDLETPDYLVGSMDTPAIWWFAGRLQFPATHMFCMQGNGRWLKLSTSQKNFGTSEADIPDDTNRADVAQPEQETVQPESEQTEQTVTAETAPKKPSLNTSSWFDFIYKQYSWKKEEADKLYEQYSHQARYELTDEKLLNSLKNARRLGKKSAELQDVLLDRWKRGDTSEALTGWIDSLEPCNKAVRKSLTIRLAKLRNFRDSKKQQREQNKGFNIELPSIERTAHGLHPNSVRALGSQKNWQIRIDETGTHFSSQADNISDSTLGRVIALVMPENHDLPPLTEAIHAVDLSLPEIQKLLAKVLQSQCGLLGATVKDDLSATNWISSVTQLIRWVLLMLPMEQQATVRVYIEQRAHFNTTEQLLALQENLEDELKRIAPERFDGLSLYLEFMTKNDSFNGYVDTIANCWGSKDNSKKLLLKHSEWVDTCLLNNSSVDSIERLYRDVSRNKSVSPELWFKLCDAASKERTHSLLNDLLNSMGENAAKNSELWQKYLAVVKQRITLKSFNALSLARALNWLNEFKPKTEVLPSLLQLQLVSSTLASQNHLGKFDNDRVCEAFALADSLTDEAAVECCETVLRIATACTNNMDFELAKPFLQHWLDKPIAHHGLLNHGKLHSMLGQLEAFTSNYEKAIDYFEKAIILFGKLSDPAIQAKETRQTESYLAIALLDSDANNASETVLSLLAKQFNKPIEQVIKQIARSEDTFRFQHYLLLRCLVFKPDLTKYTELYLANVQDWQLGEGHPWMLINAYRGWLLAEHGNKKLAEDYFQDAIDGCYMSENSELIEWMGQSLYALGCSLSLSLVIPTGLALSNTMPTHLLSELIQEKTNRERELLLREMLPFNFH